MYSGLSLTDVSEGFDALEMNLHVILLSLSLADEGLNI